MSSNSPSASASARSAADAYSQFKGAAGARNKRKQEDAVRHLLAVADLCMQPSCALLMTQDAELLVALAGETLVLQDSRAFTPAGGPQGDRVRRASSYDELVQREGGPVFGPFEQLLVGEDAAGVLDEDLQQAELGGRKAHLQLAAAGGQLISQHL